MQNQNHFWNGKGRATDESQVAPELLYSMLRIRTIEEMIAERYSENWMRCPTHLCSGQESVAAAAGLALRRDDLAVSTHRAHGHYLAKGGDMGRMLAEIAGKANGCSAGNGGSMHLIDESVGFMGSTAIVGSTIPVGVGLALAIQLKRTDQVSCIFLGDGAIEEGVFYESANFAAVRKLPVLFLCENNFYSVYSGLAPRQPEGRQIHKMVEAIGLKVDSGEGNDTEATYHTILKTADRIRGGDGPAFLEFSTYRWREHCGPNFDNTIGYRTEEEYLQWKARDPIETLKAKLMKAGGLDQPTWDEMQASANSEAQSAMDFAQSSPEPEMSQLAGHVFR